MTGTTEKAILAGGCFWGMQDLIRRRPGVVSTRVGGVPAILADGEQGLLAADNDDEGIARQVLDLLANPIRARALAAAAYDSCRAYAWSEVRDGWLAAYRQAAAPASDAHRVPLEAAR